MLDCYDRPYFGGAKAISRALVGLFLVFYFDDERLLDYSAVIK